MTATELPAIEGQIALPTGEVLTAPAVYREYSMIGASFMASLQGLRALLPTAQQLVPLEVLPGKGIVTVEALEYRSITDARGRPIADYNELLVMIPVLHKAEARLPALPLLFPQHFQTLGAYLGVWAATPPLHHVVVTTDEARDLGIQVLAMPKVTGGVEFSESAQTRRCRVYADAQEILTLEVSKTITRQRQKRSLIYTMRDGQTLRTLFEEQGEAGEALFGRAWYTLGDHPIAQQLRGLKMGHFALQREYGRRLNALLHAPAVVKNTRHLEYPEASQPITAKT